jgi:hypothetical protein
MQHAPPEAHEAQARAAKAVRNESSTAPLNSSRVYGQAAAAGAVVKARKSAPASGVGRAVQTCNRPRPGSGGADSVACSNGSIDRPRGRSRPWTARVPESARGLGLVPLPLFPQRRGPRRRRMRREEEKLEMRTGRHVSSAAGSPAEMELDLHHRDPGTGLDWPTGPGDDSDWWMEHKHGLTANPGLCSALFSKHPRCPSVDLLVASESIPKSDFKLPLSSLCPVSQDTVFKCADLDS